MVGSTLLYIFISNKNKLIMSIVIALIVVVLVSVLIAKYYPKQQTKGFGIKPIPESTQVVTHSTDTLIPKIKKEKETTKKRKYNKNKDIKKMNTKKIQ